MEELIKEYINSTDENLVDFVQKIKTGALKSSSALSYSIGLVSNRATRDVGRLTGIDVTGYKHNIKGNTIEHIENRHGKNGEHDNSMADINDYGRIKYVLDNYDSVKVLSDDAGNITRSGEYKDSNNKPAPLIRYEKRVNGTVYVVEAVPDTKAKKLQVVTAYKDNVKNGDRQVLDVVHTPQA